MPHIIETCVAGNTLEVDKYYDSGHHPKGVKRKPKCNVTKESQKIINIRRAKKKLRRLLNTNFEKGDLWVKLDFYSMPGGTKEMKVALSKFLRKMRTRYARQDTKMKYVYCMEVGPKGARHIHIVLKFISIKAIMECWSYGGIHVDPVHTDHYGKIAEYMIKYSVKTEETEKHLTGGRYVGKRYYPSKNLDKPIIKKQIVSAQTFRAYVKPKKGYYIDKESERSGISEETGYAYYHCMMVKLEKKERAG